MTINARTFFTATNVRVSWRGMGRTVGIALSFPEALKWVGLASRTHYEGSSRNRYCSMVVHGVGWWEHSSNKHTPNK